VFHLLYFYIGLGGVIGSLFRYFLAALTGNLFPLHFPFGTLIINISGAFILGWFTARYVLRQKLHPYFLTAFTSGVVGSYTTFSTFCTDTVKLIDNGELGLSLFYVLTSLVGGLVFVRMGLKLGGKSE